MFGHLFTGSQGRFRLPSKIKFRWLSGLAGCILALLVPGLTATEAGTDPGAERADRVEIRLDPLRLPASDRSRLEEMRAAVRDAIARDARMFGGFEPRDVLAETIAALRSRGARFERRPIVNFDTIEVELPAARRDEVAHLPFVRSLSTPGRVEPAAPPYDSAGLPVIRASDAHANGILGGGARVAIVDEGFHELDATIGANELPPVTLDEQFLVSADGSSIASGSSLDGLGANAHGSACAEVVGEVAPQATLSLYAVTSSAGIEAAIRHAADQGANVVLVALAEIRTLGDADPATNRYVDDVAYARAKGTTVVFAAGDEAERHYSATFAACGAGCSALGDGGGCTGDDSAYHAFSAGTPLAPLGFQVPCDSSLDPSCAITCTGALEGDADPSLFHLQLFETQGAACPSDPGATLRADVPLGQDLDLANVNSVASGYALAVLQLPGAPAPGLPNLTPRFRVDCWSPVTSMNPAVAAGSLSDMAVVPDALAVGALDGVLDPSFGTIAAYSSQGLPPADPSTVKPDLSAPSEIANFATENDPSSAASHFGGTSAAAAHAAGAVAIMQSRELMLGNPPLAVDEVKQELATAAIDLGPAGADPIYGNGRLDLPDSAIAPTALCGNGSLDPGEQCDAGAANGAPGSCCTAGCHVLADGTACSDGNSCTLGDVCQAGACVAGAPMVCTPSDPCHVAGTCDPASGLCSSPAAPDGTGCDDGNACTVGDSCLAGSCASGSPRATAVVSGDATICAGAATTLQIALGGVGPWTLVWSDGLTQSGIAASPATRSVSPSSTTTYSVTSVSDAACAGVASGSATVTVNPLPPAPSATNSGPLCKWAPLSLSASTVSGATYLWTGPNGFRSSAQNPSIAAASGGASGTYSVTATVNGCSSSPGTTAVTVNDTCPSLSFAPAAPSLNTGASPGAVAAGDFNGDGLTDLAVATRGGSVVTIYTAKATGGFATGASVAVGANPVGVVSADFDRDGNLDLAVASQGTTSIALLRGNGAGGFTPAGSIPLGAAPASLAAGDVDGDGAVDLVVAKAGTTNLAVFRGDGSGGFAASSSVAVPTIPVAIGVGDLDRDGDLDLVVADGSLLRVLRGDGTGAFSLAASFAAGTSPGALVVADLNGDGLLDVAVANQGTSNLALLTGNGSGGLAAATLFAAGGASPVALAAADTDADGRIDLLAALQASTSLSLLANTNCRSRRLAIIQDVPGCTTPGAVFSPPPIVGARDDGGNAPSCASGTVTAGIVPGSGTAGAALSGTPTVPLSAGQATFPDLSIAQAGRRYQLQFSGSSITSVSSRTFTQGLTAAISGPSSICQTTSPLYDGGAAYDSYSWRLDGTTVASTQTTQLAGLSAGLHSLVLTTTQDGCSASATLGISVTASLSSVSISPSGLTSICRGATGGTMTATVSGGGGVSHQWGYRTVSGGAITNLAGQVGSSYVLSSAGFPSAGGSFFLVDQVTPSCGTARVSNEIAIKVSAPNAAVSGDATVCAGKSSTIKATLTGGAFPWNLRWSDGGTQSNVTASPAQRSVSPQATTTYTLNSATSGDGCVPSLTGSATVSIVPVPVSTITAPSAVCVAATRINASVPRASSQSTYTWTISNGTITSGAGTDKIQFTAGTAGTTKLTASVSTPPSCSSNSSASLSVVAAPSSLINVPSSVSKNSTNNSASVFDAGTGATYAWTIQNGTITAGAGTRSIKFRAGTVSPITLSVTVTNSTGCASSSSKQITVS